MPAFRHVPRRLLDLQLACGDGDFLRQRQFEYAAVEAGLGACWMTGPLWVEDAVLEYLGCPEWGLIGITPIGWPDQTPPTPPRKHQDIEWLG